MRCSCAEAHRHHGSYNGRLRRAQPRPRPRPCFCEAQHNLGAGRAARIHHAVTARLRNKHDAASAASPRDVRCTARGDKNPKRASGRIPLHPCPSCATRSVCAVQPPSTTVSVNESGVNRHRTVSAAAGEGARARAGDAEGGRRGNGTVTTASPSPPSAQEKRVSATSLGGGALAPPPLPRALPAAPGCTLPSPARDRHSSGRTATQTQHTAGGSRARARERRSDAHERRQRCVTARLPAARRPPLRPILLVAGHGGRDGVPLLPVRHRRGNKARNRGKGVQKVGRRETSEGGLKRGDACAVACRSQFGRPCGARARAPPLSGGA